MWFIYPYQFGILSVGFCKGGKTGEPGEKRSEKGKNQQQTQPTYAQGKAEFMIQFLPSLYRHLTSSCQLCCNLLLNKCFPNLSLSQFVGQCCLGSVPPTLCQSCLSLVSILSPLVCRRPQNRIQPQHHQIPLMCHYTQLQFNIVKTIFKPQVSEKHIPTFLILSTAVHFSRRKLLVPGHCTRPNTVPGY